MYHYFHTHTQKKNAFKDTGVVQMARNEADKNEGVTNTYQTQE